MSPETPIRDIRFAGIDFESAGAARGQTDVPVQVGLASWQVGQDISNSFVTYLKSDRPITWSARKVHGIEDSDLVDAPGLHELWPTIKSRLLGSAVVAHGKGTEKRFLRAFPGHGFGPWVDTLLLARTAWPATEKHSLSRICDEQGLSLSIKAECPDSKWHDALFDTVASLKLLETIIDNFDLAAQPLACLLQPDLSLWRSLRY